jgi:hypothetical protein
MSTVQSYDSAPGKLSYTQFDKCKENNCRKIFKKCVSDWTHTNQQGIIETSYAVCLSDFYKCWNDCKYLDDTK